MVSQVVAVDGIAVKVESIIKPIFGTKRGTTPYYSLPTRGDVIIGVNRRIVAKQDEVVRMASIRIPGVCLRSQALPNGCKPSFCAFPGRIVAIEIIGSE